MDIDTRTASELCRALSHPTRLRILQFVRCCGRTVAFDEEPEAPTVGQVCCQVPVGQPTVSHHLKELARVGLVTFERRGRSVLCRAREETLAALARFLTRVPEDIEEGSLFHAKS
ncbi:MAG TPA: metalloregulator ArsR/SmtB family transcription factor [Candidatus Nitrosotenuis sp.]|jgi:DNA-binding transcriptional ArsR family regulator|nr:metalloregulator ArsR/SmtB family transcription factor [Candidatus Nitrosotenuis sp.]